MSRARKAWLLLVLVCAAATPADRAMSDASSRSATPALLRSLYLDGDAVGDHMVVVGEHGNILVSRDGGRHWTHAATPTRSTLTGVALHDARRGWAVGHDAVILRTDDGGSSWELVHAAPDEERTLLDVWFRDAEHGIAVGAFGYVLETTDGGDTWHVRDVADTDRHLNHIAATASGRIYVAAESGRIFRSDDGAKSWKALPSPYAGSLFGTLPIDEERIYVYGLRGHLFRSDDGGATWKPVDTGIDGMLTGGLVLDAELLVFTAMGGVILSGPSDASSTSPHRRDDRADLAGALPTRDGALVVFGERGVERIPRERFEPGEPGEPGS